MAERMIAQITGSPLSLRDGLLVLDVHGLAFELLVPGRLALQPDDMGLDPFEPKTIHAHLHVREDLLQLYGFDTAADRDTFRLLLEVDGVGPRTALAFLSEFSSPVLVSLIAGRRTDLLCKAKGVGKKTAERVAIELHDKLSDIIGAAMPPELRERTNALFSTLIRLGFSSREANEASGEVSKLGPLPIADMVKASLQALGSRAS